MSITYAGAGGLFTHLGALIARTDSYAPLGNATLPADLAGLLAVFGTGWLPEQGIQSYYGGMQDGVTGWRRGLARFADYRLLDPATVLTQLSSPLPSGVGIAALIPALMRQMALDAQTVKASVCSVGPVTPASGNVGTGNAYPTLTLDGYNAPLYGGMASATYLGASSQLCRPSEPMVLECVADGATDGLAAGDEVWSWKGLPKSRPFDWRPEGSGQGPSIRTDNGSASLVGNGGFASWSANVPSRWTLDSGTAGVHLIQAGTEALFAGDGSTAIQISQAVAPAAKRRHHVSVLARMLGATAGTLSVGFPGGGASVAVASLGASAAPVRVHVNTPPSVAAGSLMTLRIDGLNAGGQVWLSSVAAAPTVYHGGVGVDVLAGASPWTRGDRLSFTVTNDQGGKFQDWFRRRYGVQLPSVAVASQGPILSLLMTMMAWGVSPTLSDSLVA